MKKVILLNGPSSSGKSTLSKALQKLIKEMAGERFSIISIDDHMKISEDETIYEDDVFEINGDICKSISKELEDCGGVIIDHVITSECIFVQLIKSIDQHEMHMIKVTCPTEILIQREKERRNRCLGSALTSYEYLYPKLGYDLTVDTHSSTVQECAMLIYKEVFK